MGEFVGLLVVGDEMRLIITKIFFILFFYFLTKKLREDELIGTPHRHILPPTNMPMKSKSNNKIQKTKTKQKPSHKSTPTVSKSKSKSTKMKLDRLNADISEFNEVTQLLKETTNANDAKKDNLKSLELIKEDYVKDEENKKKDQAANEEIKKQMQLLSDIGL